MGLRETFKNAALTAIAAFGDVRVSANYWSHVSTTFDVSAGTPADVYGTTTGVMVIFDDFRISEIDGEAITPQDRRVLIPAKSLASTPAVNDKVVASGVTWNVQGVRSDPAEALWDLHARRS